MTRTAKKMFKDMGYEYSEKYTSDDEKALEYIQYEKECEIIRFYIAGKFWGKCHKKGVLVQNMNTTNMLMQQRKKQRLLFSNVKN